MRFDARSDREMAEVGECERQGDAVDPRATAPVCALMRVLEEVYGFHSTGEFALLCQIDISYFPGR